MIPRARGLAALCFLIAVSAFLTPVVNPDLHWHLSAGRLIWVSGSIPRQDWLSHTRLGAPWTDIEWLSQVALYACRHAAGCAGIIGLRVLLLSLALLATLRRLPVGAPGLLSIGALWLGAGLLPSSDARPENWSLLFFAAQALALDRGRTLPARGLLPATALGYALWASLHPGFIFGLALIGLETAGAACEKRGSGRLNSRVGELALTGAVGAVAALANPHGWRVYGVAAEHISWLGFLSGTISEWTPPGLEIGGYWPFWILAAVAAPVLVRRVRQGEAGAWSSILAAAFFLWSALRHRRNVPYFMIAALPSVLAGLKVSARAGGPAAAALTAHIAWFAWGAMLPGSPWPWCLEPGRRAADFLEAHSRDLGGMKLYHGWGLGGYFGWRLYPVYRVFFDGRYIFHGLLRESLEARADGAWELFLDRHGVDLAVLRAGGPESLLMPRRTWAVLHAAGKDVIYARVSALPASLRRRLNPGRSWTRPRPFPA